MNNVFGLDIGTRNVVGTVGYQTDDKEFVVTAQYVREHETRAMLDGQIHDIGRVAKTIKEVKDELEKQTGQPLEEVCIAAAGRVLKTVTTHVEYEYAQESVVTGETCACFEPALDYVVVKYPKWPFDKFVYADKSLGTQMMATGEVMAIGNNFEHAMMKAVSLRIFPPVSIVPGKVCCSGFSPDTISDAPISPVRGSAPM